MKRNVAILGAGGRDFHNFLVKYKHDAHYDVKFFTAAQIPGIEKRTFPKELAGSLYKHDIPIYSDKLPELIKKFEISEVVLAYSDLNHIEVMHKASIALASGASFTLLGPKDTMIKSSKPVISICAVRTGSGKSQTSRKIADLLKESGKKVVAIRHPMPYGDLMKQRCQRFSSYADLEKNKCTIEEREEYEPWINKGIVIYAGVDYEEIIKKAEREAQVIVWDGGNNDLPFYKPDLHIVVADPHRAGHELLYHPGEANFRMADVIVINKIDTASKTQVKIVEDNIQFVNSKALVIKAESKLLVSNEKQIRNKRVIVVEDGPTVTHGGMSFGAGYVVAKRNNARIISPKPYAIGSLKETYNKYSQVSQVLPAMGYSPSQVRDLEQTINRIPADLVIDGSPINLSRVIKSNKPIINVSYILEEKGLSLKDVLKRRGFLK